MRLGNEKLDSESDDQFWEIDDSDSVDSDDDKEVDENTSSSFNFCQIVGEGGPDD